MKSCMIVNERMKPANNAIGVSTNGNKHNTATMMNNPFFKNLNIFIDSAQSVLKVMKIKVDRLP